MEVINEILIHMDILLMTSDFFFTLEEAFSDNF